MRPRQSVAIHENTLIPVGIAMSSVVIIIGTRSQSAMPATNMWCAQTENPSTRIPSRESAMRRYPKIGFLDIEEMTSDTIPKPGSIMM